MKKLIIIIPILIVIIASIFLLGGKKKKPDDIKFCEDIEEVCEIVYTRDARTGKLTREENFWYFEGEDRIMADRAMVEEQLEVLSTISPKDIVKKIKNEDNYGLKEPKYSISITDNNSRTRSIYVGNVNEDKDYYIRIDDQEEIYIVSKEIKDVIVRFDSQQRMFDRFDAYTTPTR